MSELSEMSERNAVALRWQRQRAAIRLRRPAVLAAWRDAAVPALLFCTATLVAVLASFGTAFVREDVMWIEIMSRYAPLDVLDVFANGIQGVLAPDFPTLDWPYRPVEHLMIPALLGLFGEDISSLLLLKSAVLGVNAVLIYLLVLETGGRRISAAISALLFSLSVPALIESMWYHHMQSYLQVLILLGLLSYLRYARGGARVWLGLTAATALIAPWLEEAGLSIAAIALAHAVLTRRADPKLLAVLALLALHGTFPSFLPQLLLEHRLDTTSIFSTFILGEAVQAGVEGFQLQASLPYLTVFLLPPLISVAALLSLGVSLAGAVTAGRRPRLIAAGGGLLLLTLVAFLAVYPPPAHSSLEPRYVAAAILPLTVAALSLRFGLFLPLWFAISYLPFLGVRSLPVNHFPFAIPWIILVVSWVVALPEAATVLARLRWPRVSGARLTAAVVVVLVIGGASQLLNVPAVRASWVNLAANTREMGRFASAAMLPGSVVLGERDGFFEAIDLAYYSDGVVEGRLAVHAPVLYPTDPLLATELPAFLASGAYSEVYVLLQQGVPEVLHNYVREQRDDFELMAQFEVQGRLPRLDPIALLLPHESSVYRGLGFLRIYPSGRGGLFFSELTTRYSLYRYAPRAAREASSYEGAGQYGGYSLLRYGERYYAIAPGDGPFDYERFITGAYDGHTARTLAELKRAIDGEFVFDTPLLVASISGQNVFAYQDRFYVLLARAGRFEPGRLEAGEYDAYPFGYSLRGALFHVPRAVDPGYKGLVIVAYAGRFFGVPHAEWSADRSPQGGTQPAAPQERAVFAADSVAAVRSAIDGAGDLALANMEPTVVRAGYRGFDIVVRGQRYYGLPGAGQRRDIADVERAEAGGFGVAFIFSRLDDVQNAIDISTNSPGGPYLVEEGFNGFNIIFFGGHFYAIPQSEGAFDASRVRRDGYSQSYVEDTLSRLKSGVLDDLRGVPTFEELYRGFQIVRYGAAFYAIPVSAGAADAARLQESDYPILLSGSSVDAARRAVDRGSSALGTVVNTDFRGFTIARYGAEFYAVPRGEGSFDFGRILRNGYSKTFVGSTLAEVQQLVSSYTRPGAVLVESNYRAFNIIAFDSRFYAIPTWEGSFDIDRLHNGGYSQTHVGATIAEVLAAIDAGPPVGPYLVASNERGFNLIQLGRLYYAIPNDEGGFETARIFTRDYSRFFVGSSVAELRALIGALP